VNRYSESTPNLLINGHRQASQWSQRKITICACSLRCYLITSIENTFDNIKIHNDPSRNNFTLNSEFGYSSLYCYHMDFKVPAECLALDVERVT